MIRNQAVIQVTGWLNDVKSFDWGSAAKVSVDQRKQNAEGQWETVYRDWETIGITGRKARVGGLVSWM